ATPEPLQPSRSAVGMADRQPRDASQVRTRLSGFQRGVQRGKHRACNTDELPPESAPAPEPAPEPKPEKRAARNGRPTGDAVNGSEPSSFTESGLPRRRRGEQLLPGSVGSVAKAPVVKAPQPDRDPAAMRGRLNSFQQGLRRGRGTSAATPVTPANETDGTPVSKHVNTPAAPPARATKSEKMEGE
ncbi:MAG: hypothetical protein ACRDQB_05760, partial [Thermocrispum sp.]